MPQCMYCSLQCGYLNRVPHAKHSRTKRAFIHASIDSVNITLGESSDSEYPRHSRYNPVPTCDPITAAHLPPWYPPAFDTVFTDLSVYRKQMALNREDYNTLHKNRFCIIVICSIIVYWLQPLQQAIVTT